MSGKRSELGRVVILTTCLGLVQVWGAEPEWKANLTRLPAGDFPVLEPCELVFHLSWSNILKAGETKIRFYNRGQDGKTPGELYTQAEMRSSGLARTIWPYDGKTESWVKHREFLPVKVLQEEEDRQEKNVYRTDFGPAKVTNAWTSVHKKKGGPAEVKSRSYEQTDPPIRDLVAAMLYLRSLPLKGLKGPVTLVCYPFRDPYLVTVTPLGVDPHEMLGRKVDAMKFEVSLAKIESDQTLKKYDEKMKTAHFWISDDALRLPLELRAELFIGSILVTLKEYRSLDGPGAKPAGRLQPVVADTEDRAVERRRLIRRPVKGMR